MAALPRKWVSDGAPPLPWIRGSAIRNQGGFILRHDPFFSREAASTRARNSEICKK
jgi:hypothetical protein